MRFATGRTRRTFLLNEEVFSREMKGTQEGNNTLLAPPGVEHIRVTRGNAFPDMPAVRQSAVARCAHVCNRCDAQSDAAPRQFYHTTTLKTPKSQQMGTVGVRDAG